MADENTTASNSTTTVPPAADSSTSTTATSPATSPPQADAAPPPVAETPPAATEGGTILTPDAETGDTRPSAEEQAAIDAKAALFGAPEGDYELSGLPEGTVIDTETLAVVAPIAKELGLSNEGLSKLAAPFAEKIVPHITEQVTQQILASHAATTKGWADETIAAVGSDAAFGGKPLAEVQAVAAKALDRFGGTEFRQYLADTGLGNHPAMVKAMFLAGSAIAEDTTFERGGAVSDKPPRVPGKLNPDRFYTKT